jgi:SAM-dependent methyltransferase
MQQFPQPIKVKQERSVWENNYTNGQWECLRGKQEFAHYTVVAGYIQREKRPVSLLDIGCGEGVILHYLNLDLIKQYTGLDVAQAALDKISPRRKQDDYICSSLENYRPDRGWDVILFNEVLYYTFDPVKHLKQFETALNAGGFYVISMFRKNNPFATNNRCIRRVRRHLREASYQIEDAVQVSKLYGSASWQMWLVRPPFRCPK